MGREQSLSLPFPIQGVVFICLPVHGYLHGMPLRRICVLDNILGV